MFLRNRFSNKAASTLLLGATLCAGLVTYGSLSTAKVDLLQIPAIPSVNATRSLILDVERVGKNLFAAGEFGQILKSEDNGKTWTAGKVPVSITLTSVAFANDAVGYAVGHDGVETTLALRREPIAVRVGMRAVPVALVGATSWKCCGLGCQWKCGRR